ncbi:SDR family NAD(P)-dependent oxidoreductase [Paenibacillus terrigena]|uniref:SDR family NAD(P)-dependent oxidoreductase n=1 Tax=Paenibacillus terrigena TaxID=369333 RepID=UPI0003812969|nr:SDR family NAD(P)-dependent oxidoreductase [Paenibacillus terrigena]
MRRNHFIITGTSRGIGEQLAKMLLEQDHKVHGISRGDSSLTEFQNYTHIHYDLSDTSGIENLMDTVFNQIDLHHADMICLVNNAAMAEPLKPIEQCTLGEIHRNLQISLVAPMLLTSCFINLSENVRIRRKIINISSGSGSYPAPDMSVYCTAKAGLNMFSQCVGLEQGRSQFPVEIIAVDPGMVDTEMQMLAREKNAQEFEMAKYFKHAHQTGQLLSTEALCRHLLNMIEKTFEPGKLVKYTDA